MEGRWGGALPALAMTWGNCCLRGDEGGGGSGVLSESSDGGRIHYVCCDLVIRRKKRIVDRIIGKTSMCAKEMLCYARNIVRDKGDEDTKGEL